MSSNVIALPPRPRCPLDDASPSERGGSSVSRGLLVASFLAADSAGNAAQAITCAAELESLWVESSSEWAFVEATVQGRAHGADRWDAVAASLIRQGWWHAQLGDVARAVRLWRQGRSIAFDMGAVKLVAAAELGLRTPQAPVRDRPGGLAVHAEVAAEIRAVAERAGASW